MLAFPYELKEHFYESGIYFGTFIYIFYLKLSKVGQNFAD
jgi:hypothetical protein